MKRINNQQKELMKKLREQGKSYRAIGKELGFNHNTILYHLNEKIRKKRIKENVERFRKKPLEERRKEYAKRKDYIRNYQANKYKTNEEFRIKERERVKKYQRRISFLHFLKGFK